MTGPARPLDTLLRLARRAQERRDLVAVLLLQARIRRELAA